MARLADLVRRARPADARAPGRRPATGTGGRARSVRRRRLAVRHSSRRGLSPSLAWFASLTHFAVHVVGARRVTPEVLDEGPFTVARWRPVLTDEHRARARPRRQRGTGDLSQRLERLHRRHRRLADRRTGTGRAAPRRLEARPGPQAVARGAGDAGRVRRARQARSGRSAAATPDSTTRLSTSSHASTGTGGASTASRSCADGCGSTLPDDALDPWLVELELVDDADPGKWCTADDVWERAPRALDVAGGERRLAALEHEVLNACRRRWRRTSPVWPSWPPSTSRRLVELDLEQADEFIEVRAGRARQARDRTARPRATRHVKVARPRHRTRVAGRRPQGTVRQGGARRLDRR